MPQGFRARKSGGRRKGGRGGDVHELRWHEALLPRGGGGGRRILSGLVGAEAASLEAPIAGRVRSLTEDRRQDLEGVAVLEVAHRPVIESVVALRVTAPCLLVCGHDDVSPRPLAAVL